MDERAARWIEAGSGPVPFPATPRHRPSRHPLTDTHRTLVSYTEHSLAHYIEKHMTDVQATTTRRWKQPPRTAKSNKMGGGVGDAQRTTERERDRDGSGAGRGLLRLLRRQTHSQRQNGGRGRDGGSVKCETKKTKRTPPSRGDGDEATWAMQRSVGERTPWKGVRLQVQQRIDGFLWQQATAVAAV